MTSSQIHPGVEAIPSAESEASPIRRSLLGEALFDTFGQAGARAGACWIAILVVLGVFAPFLANSHPIVYRLTGSRWQFPLFQYLTAVDVILVLLFVHAAVVLVRKVGAGLSISLIIWPILVIAAAGAFSYLINPLIHLSLYQPDSLTGADGAAKLGLWAIVVLIHALVAAAIIFMGLLLYRATLGLYRSAVVEASRSGLFTSACVVAALGIVAALWVRPPENVVYEKYRQAATAGQVEFSLHTPIPFSANDRLRDGQDVELRSPNRVHWLGTTQFGEDLLSRLLHACRVALAIGLIATSISTLIGIFTGGLMGYFAGKVDLFGMRIVEIVESIPTLLLLLIVTVSFGRNLYIIMVVIGLLSWTSDARFIRGEFFRLRNMDFVQAATAAGLGRTSIIFRHMLPNGVAPVLVNASFGVAGAILLESTLSFLGLGLGVDDPSWGQLLEQALSGAGFSWWIATFPGLAIFLTVFSYILIGEAMRDAIDPKLKKAA